ncbi:MAG TPA: GIDE domain-containing protein [Steroidobacteraceae bacterium]
MAEDFWFWLLALAVAVVAGGVAAMRWLRVARLIEDTPTSRIRSAAQGYVELSGRGVPLPGTQNLAPLTQRPCLWWRYKIEKKTENGSGKTRRQAWQKVASGISSMPFLLDDETGQCIVKPEGADIVAGESLTWYGDTPWPTVAPGRTPLFTGGRDYRYFEERIYEHERLYALGDFVSTRSSAEQDLQAQQVALLNEWKQDQAALTARFDADRDGKVSLEEWEKAREAARHAVQERRAEQPARPVHHVLCRPTSGQLFLLAALPPGDLARRYRRRAILAFLGFIVGVYALGWLLQGAFG